MKLMKFSDDSMSHILSFLTPKHLTSLLLVNKQFLTWCATYILSVKQDVEFKLSNDTFQMLFDSCSKKDVTRLVLDHLDDADLLANAREFPHLSELSLSGKFQVGEAVRQLEPVLHQIDHFTMKLIEHKNKILENEAFLDLFKGLENSASIHHLSFDNCYCFLSQSYDFNMLKRLTSLELRNESLERALIYTDADKNILTMATNLTHLEISFSGVLPYDCRLKQMLETCCKNLKSFSLFNSAIAIPCQSEEEEDHTMNTKAYELFPSLERLSLNTSLMIDEAFFISDPDWHSVLAKLKHLEWIEIAAGKGYENNVTRADFLEILKQCVELRTLVINRIEDNRFVSECFDYLLSESVERMYEKIDLSETAIDSRALASLIRYCPHLVELTARAPFSMHHMQTARLVEGMNFGGEFMSEDELSQKIMFDSVTTNLRILDLSNCIISDHFFIFVLSNGRNLKKLVLDGTIRKNPLLLDYKPYADSLTLDNLHIVQANECDSAMAVLILSHLNMLNVSGLKRLELSDVRRVAISFNVGDFNEIEKEMGSILKRCKDLHTLKVNGITTFDDDCLESLAQAGAAITTLHIADTSCSADAVLALNLGQVSNLQFVSCVSISNLSTLHTLLQRLTNVNKLSIDVTGCGMTDETWNIIGAAGRHLTRLKIVGRPSQKISEEVFMDVTLNKLVHLRHLYLDYCPLTEKNLSKLDEQVRKQRFSSSWRIPLEEISEESGWGCNLQ